MKIVLFGKPGAGKGTQAALLAKKFGIPHISTGDIFRQHMANHTLLGEEVRKVMESGNLVSDELTIRVAESAIRGKYSWILDGFPRSKDQAIWTFSKYSDAKYIHLDVSRNVSIARIKVRSLEMSRPEDATPESISTRFDAYAKITVPAINYICLKHRLIEVDGSKTIDEVFQHILSIIE